MLSKSAYLLATLRSTLNKAASHKLLKPQSLVYRQIIMMPARQITNVSDFFTAPAVKERDLKRVAVTDSKLLFS
jgi:hypothetical protein